MTVTNKRLDLQNCKKRKLLVVTVQSFLKQGLFDNSLFTPLPQAVAFLLQTAFNTDFHNLGLF